MQHLMKVKVKLGRSDIIISNDGKSFMGKMETCVSKLPQRKVQPETLR